MRATLSATPRLRRQACSRGFAYAVDLAGVQAAHQRIESHVHRTPVFRSSAIDAMAGCNVHFKCEVFQRSGAFKIRGAANALLSLSPEELERGVSSALQCA
jgi:threonine dehydratase